MKVSLSAITPLVFVITRFCAARSGNSGCSGGASSWVWPNWARVQLILVNNRKPLRAPLWPKRLLLLASLAGGDPGGPLLLLECPPTGGDLGEDATDGHLRLGARVGGDGESAADLAELASL